MPKNTSVMMWAMEPLPQRAGKEAGGEDGALGV